jgi:hypothetical protein
MGSKTRAAISRAALDYFLLARHGDGLAHLADGHFQRQIQLVGHPQHDLFAPQRLEAAAVTSTL